MVITLPFIGVVITLPTGKIATSLKEVEELMIQPDDAKRQVLQGGFTHE